MIYSGDWIWAEAREQCLGDQRKAPPERGVAAALGAVLVGPYKAPLVSPAIHAAQHERAGRAYDGGKHDRLLPPAYV